jgi:hypothetical protein
MAQVVHRADNLPSAKRLHKRQFRLHNDAAGRTTELDLG